MSVTTAYPNNSQRVASLESRLEDSRIENKKLIDKLTAIPMLTSHIVKLTTECDELRAALKEQHEQAEADYVSLQEAYLQCQKDLYAESEQLKELRATLESGVRVHANPYIYHDNRWLCLHYESRKDIHNATLILDDRVET